MYFMAINKIKKDIDFSNLGPVISSHIKWTQKQISTGKIVQAGKWGEAGGMSIIKAGDEDEAKNVLEEDPLIK